MKNQELMNALMALPVGKQRAVIWLIKNYQYVVEMCEEGPLTDEQSLSLEKEAIEKNDDYMLVLILFERVNRRARK